MDNLCHTLAGAALGRAGLADRTRYGMATLLVAANLPDIDVAVFLTDTLPMSFRRGWTHGILAQIALPMLLAGVMLLIARWRPPRVQAGASPPPPARFSQLLLLSFVGLYSHILLDWLNSYGVRLLMPFSNRWFYGDALYIVDPWMWLVLGAGVIAAGRRRARRHPQARRPARMALAVVGVYCLAMLVSNAWARNTVQTALTRAGQPEARFMVTPVVVNPFRREVIIDTGRRYEKGDLWFEPAPHFRPGGYGVDIGLDTPAGAAVRQQPRAQAYLRWSRFPFLVPDNTTAPPRHILNDYRYSDSFGRVGWAGMALTIGN
ncbi:MAG: metal-dependent hydrolase [Acidobacteria bacterium]|nr:metal-dependent hydrolase [Acidobacteriota bacterium]